MDAVDYCSDPGNFVTPRNETVEVGVLTREGVFTVNSNAIARDVNIQKVRGGVFKQVISEAYVVVKLMKVV